MRKTARSDHDSRSKGDDGAMRLDALPGAVGYAIYM